MKRLLVLALCLAPTFAHAQPLPAPIPIHGHPQLKEYTDVSQFPSWAVHLNWAAGENPIASQVGGDGKLDIVAGRLGNSKLGHAHLGFTNCPLYRELTGPITCRFAIVLFNGQLHANFNPRWQSGIRDIVWDDTGTTTPPEMITVGAEKTFRGSLVIDPNFPSQFPTQHGWWSPGLSAVFTFENGTHVDKLLYASFFNMLDPTAPETDGVPFVSGRVDPHELVHNENWGSNQVETLRGSFQYLPLAPLKAHERYPVIFATGGYGAANLPPAIAERRDDSDIHHQIPGVVREEITQNGNIEIHTVFDADAMGPGTHKVIIGRRQIGLFGDQAVVTQLVFDVKVEGAAPPPPPPPPPPPVLAWQSWGLGTWNVSFEREVNQTTGTATGRQRACIGGQCLVIEKP